MSQPFLPMLSYYLEEIDPGMNGRKDEGAPRLQRVRVLLQSVRKRPDRQGLFDASGPGGLATMLAPPLPNGKTLDGWLMTERGLLLESLFDPKATNPPLATRLCPTLCELSSRSADALDEVERSMCVPVRYSDTVVALGDATSLRKSRPRLVISWPREVFKIANAKCNPRVVIERGSDTSIVLVTFGATGLQNTIYVKDMQKGLLDHAFASLANAQFPQGPSAPIRFPKRPGDVPDMMQLQLAAFAQNRLRAQVLVTAAHTSEESSRPLGFENMKVRWVEAGIGKPPFMAVDAYFHKTSATCFCGAHHLKPIQQRWPGKVFTGECDAVMSMKICARAIDPSNEDATCPLHGPGTCKDQVYAPGICCSLCSVTFECKHAVKSTTKQRLYEGSKFWCVLDHWEAKELSMLLGVVARYDRQARPVLEKPMSERPVEEIKKLVVKAVAEMDSLIQRFDVQALRERDPKDHLSDDDLLRLDLLALARLREGGLYRNKKTFCRTEGSVSQAERKLIKHHHWMFPDKARASEITVPAQGSASQASHSSQGLGSGLPPPSPSPVLLEEPEPKRIRRDPAYNYQDMNEFMDPSGFQSAKDQLVALMADPDLPSKQRARGLHFQQVLDACDANFGAEMDGPLGLPARPLLCKYRTRNDGGRLYPTEMPMVSDVAKGKQRPICIQGMPRELRPFLCCRWGHDYDMANAQPQMLRQMARTLHWTDGRTTLTMPELEKWCTNRPEYIEHVADHHGLPTDAQRHYEYRKDIVKELMIRLMFGGAYKAWRKEIDKDSQWPPEVVKDCKRVVALAQELQDLRKAVFESNEWVDFVARDRDRLRREGEKETEEKIDRSVFARIAQKTENEVLTVMRTFLRERGWTVLSLCFDGVRALHTLFVHCLCNPFTPVLTLCATALLFAANSSASA